MSSSQLPFISYRAPRLPDAKAIHDELDRVVAGGVWNRGPLTRAFETEIAARAGTTDAVLVSSAIAALTLLLRAEGARGAVLLPAFQFPPVLIAIRDAGLHPVFVDVDREYWTTRQPADPGKSVAGFLGAPSFGEISHCSEGERWGRAHGKPVWFDSCHAFGSQLGERVAGSFGRAEVFSLTPSKLVIAGEGGVVTTNDTDLSRELRTLRDYGKREDGRYDERGASVRASEWTAAAGLASLATFPAELERRRRIDIVWRETLAGIPGISFQSRHDALQTNGQECVIRIDETVFGRNRDAVRAVLHADGIETIPTYLRCLSDSPVRCPVASALERELLHLPTGINVDREVVERVARSLSAAVQGHAADRSS